MRESDGGPAIDAKTLDQIAERFRFRWDPPILAVLADRALRFRAIHRQLELTVGDHVDDNTLSRSLRRLIRVGHVTVETKRIGQRDFPFYGITAAGREQLNTYRILILMFRHATRHSRDHDDRDRAAGGDSPWAA